MRTLIFASHQEFCALVFTPCPEIQNRPFNDVVGITNLTRKILNATAYDCTYSRNHVRAAKAQGPSMQQCKAHNATNRHTVVQIKS